MAGIYIHIPFCRQACNYCNFHFSTSLGQKEALIAALIKEIGLPQKPHLSFPMGKNTKEIDNKINLTGYSGQSSFPPATFLPPSGKIERGEVIQTIYFGGGTPSLLSIEELTQIFAALQKNFIVAADAEITLEANPDDITGEKLKSWLALGINRLSVGIQSFVEEELKWMNRAHTAAESIMCIDKIKAAGFTNFSVDLIYGSPVLSNEDWKKNVDTIIQKGIPHISCYALTVEPKTALDKLIAAGKKEMVSSEKQAEQFILLMDWLKAAGYEHYEISNFARPGMRSKHNSSYWSGATYYGFGPSAHSFDGTSRRWNIANNALYIQSIEKGIIPLEEETLTLIQQVNEYTMTSLRTMEGLDLDHVKEKFGAAYSDGIFKASIQYAETGKLKTVKNRLVLTNEGKLFADGIAADLFL